MLRDMAMPSSSGSSSAGRGVAMSRLPDQATSGMGGNKAGVARFGEVTTEEDSAKEDETPEDII
jgi:hypothetical protein